MTPKLRQLSLPVAAISPHPRNPRRGDIEAIKQSLKANGQFRPIVVNSRTNEVLAGNHTLLAARELGWPKIAATLIDADEEQAKRILLADNRTSDLASYDERLLAEVLGELEELEGTGYEQADLDALLDQLAEDEPLPDDEPPPLPREPKTKPGDRYRLGRHRLVCADAREPASYRLLLGHERADLLWTDPPYGVEYSGRTARRLRLQNDGPAGLEELLRTSFAAADGALAPGSPLYVAHPAGPLCATFIAAFCAPGWQLRQTLVWVKDSLVLGHADYHYRHEPLLYGYKPAKGRLGRGGRGWYGGNAQTSVFEIARPKASREHPTAKPPELVAAALRNSSERGALVLDPFAGSGSTLVACEALARSARLIELDPRYCDVVVERWQKLSGHKAKRERR